MDNYTLLTALILVLGINTIFTFILSGKIGREASLDWKLSSVLLFAGFFLLMFQQHLSSFFSIITANYILFMGFYLQVSAALSFLSGKPQKKTTHITISSVLYLGTFLYFTYLNFNTPARIITISLMLAGLYFYSLVRFRRIIRKRPQTTEIKELYIIFLMAAVFYTTRAGVTIIGLGAVDSLFDRNISISISFIFPMIFTLSFYMGMFSAAIREKNRLISREKDRFNYLFDFLNKTAKHLELEELYPSIEEVLRKSLGVNSAAIHLLEEDKETLSIVYYFNDLELPLNLVKKIKIDESNSGKAISEDRVIEMDMREYHIKKIAEAYMAKGVTEMISAPINSPNGRIGAITIVYTDSLKESVIFDSSFFYYLGEQIGLVLNNALLYKKVTGMANTDPLTGLYNRRRMQELFSLELKRAERGGSGFVIAMADLDHFKDINDNFSHKCGDDVLRSAAEIFRHECRESDYICRWGGEEFLLIFIDSDLTAAKTVAERIRGIFENNRCGCIDDSSVTISIGLTEYAKGLSMEQLTANADEALYRAKEKGRNRIEIK